MCLVFHFIWLTIKTPTLIKYLYRGGQFFHDTWYFLCQNVHKDKLLFRKNVLLQLNKLNCWYLPFIRSIAAICNYELFKLFPIYVSPMVTIKLMVGHGVHGISVMATLNCRYSVRSLGTEIMTGEIWYLAIKLNSCL